MIRIMLTEIYLDNNYVVPSKGIQDLDIIYTNELNNIVNHMIFFYCV